MIVVAAAPLASPCGACRQFLVEFGKQIVVISVNADNPTETKSWTTEALIPENFRL
jgi:cytidine deaminase